MNKQDEFILDYLEKNIYTDATDQLFHEEFFALFGGQYNPKNFGAQTVRKAQQRLKILWEKGDLERHKVGLAGHERGFPKWVYSYSIKST